MRIIPAIDIIGGKCVRLTKGDFSTAKIYNEDPVETAKEFEHHGISYLHVVDLDGARDGLKNNRKILERISAATKLKIDFGGGIKTKEDIFSILDSGAVQVNIGTIAAVNQELFMEWLSIFGPEKIILGADSLKRKVQITGWQDKTETDIIDYIQHYVSRGIRYVVCTDVSKDGTLTGPSVELYSEILRKNNLSLIASGGISCLNDIEDVRKAGCEGVIIGKAIYEGRITLKNLGSLC